MRRRILGLLIAVHSAGPVAGQQQGGVAGAEASAAIAALGQRPDAAVLARFWARVGEEGAPLVEPDTANGGYSIVTFIARGDPEVERVRLESNLTALLVGNRFVLPDSLGWLERLGGTDVWYRSFRLRNDVRVPYELEITRRGGTPELVVDPLNPAVWEPGVANLRASILELPGASPQPWRTASAEEGEGKWAELTEEYGGRHVYVYLPRTWSDSAGGTYPLLIGLDSFGHGIGMRVDRMVDALIATGRLPPLVVALVDLRNEDEASRYEATYSFIRDELLPVLRDRFHATADAADVVVSGTSRRGLVATLLAFEHPETFGNAVSLSGSFYWRPHGETEYEWLARRVAESPRRPVRLHLEAGELETFVTPGNAGHYMVGTNRHMRDVLRARGYDLEYLEFNGVHSELNWQDGLARGLARLLGR